MKTLLRSFLGSLLAIVVVLAIGVAVVAIRSSRKPDVPDDAYLVVDLYGSLPEYDPPSGLLGSVMGGDGETLHRVLSNLRKARRDDRIAGVVLKLSSNLGAGPAKLQEIGEGVRRVREAGKPVYAWGDSFDRGTFYLASTCDSVFAPPTAYIQLTGFAAGSLHFRDALRKLGVEPQLHRIKDYKAAAEMVTRSDMSEPVRRNREWILDDVWRQYAAALADGRGIDEERLTGLMELAVMRAEEAVAGGLIDRLLYWDELRTRLSGDPEKAPPVVTSAAYGKIAEKDVGLKGDRKIAVVHAQGLIGGRESRVDPLLGVMMGHQTVVADLERAVEDDDVAAIVLRVDSGGGDALTSDLIGRGVEVAARSKPVVVSMVDVAASGGYDVSYRASRIVACPLTIAGSIGSISGKFNLAGLYEKLGIAHDAVTRGPNALWDADYLPYTEAQAERHARDHWEGFNAWLRDVAEHRHLAFADAESLAHGRVFTGSQAADNGLVDEVGGLEAAVAAACRLAGLEPEEPVSLVHYPERKDLLQTLLSGDDEGDRALSWALYRLVHHQLAETWELLASGRLDAAPLLPE